MKQTTIWKALAGRDLSHGNPGENREGYSVFASLITLTTNRLVPCAVNGLVAVIQFQKNS
jgi:hypothetical protein